MAASLGGRIKLARKASGMSLRELAERVGISAMAISKYERGILNPSSVVLIRLANALSVKSEFFFRKAPEDASLMLYRKHASLQKKEEDAINAKIQDWLERYLEIESFLKESSHDFDLNNKWQIYRLDEIEDISNRIRKDWNLGLDPIENLIDTLEQHSIKIFQIGFDKNFDACTFMQGGYPVIAVNASFSGDRQRFSIAHELGHIVLGVGNEELIEKAAHRFAGAFLLPKDAAFQELGEKRSSLSLDELYLVKHKYGISMQATVYRAKDLNIINENIFNQLFREFSVKGYRQVEPGEPLAAEKPKRMQRLVLRLLSEGIISKSRAEELYQGDLFEIGGAAIM